MLKAQRFKGSGLQFNNMWLLGTFEKESPIASRGFFFFRLCTPVFHSDPKATFHLMFYVISYDLFPISPHNGALVPGCLHLRRKKSDLDFLYYSGFVNSSRNVFSL